MDVKDNIIDLYNEVLVANKNLLGLARTTRRAIGVMNKNMILIGIATAACMIFTHRTISEQQKTITDLSEQVAELKMMKGE